MYYSARCLIWQLSRADSDHMVRNQLGTVVKSFLKSSHAVVAVSSRSQKNFEWTEGTADLENCYANVSLVPARIGSHWMHWLRSIDQGEASVLLRMDQVHDCVAATDRGCLA
jgi:hypothetical protein